MTPTPPASPLGLGARRGVVYDCPWCETRVVDLQPYVSPELRYFELHLDVHLRRGDHLRVVQATPLADLGASESEQPATGRAVGARPTAGKAA